MGTRIKFNGTEYASVEEMPEDERRRYELVMQQFRTLQPDAGANAGPGPIEVRESSGVNPMVHTRVVVRNRTFKSPDELPPELRREYDEALKQAGTGTVKTHGGFTLSVVTTRESAGQHPTNADMSQPGVVPGGSDPGAARGESNIPRLALAIASIIVIAVAAWLLFGPRLAGH